MEYRLRLTRAIRQLRGDSLPLGAVRIDPPAFRRRAFGAVAPAS